MFITLAIATTGISPEEDHVLALSTAGAYIGYRIYQCPGVIPAKATEHHGITKALSNWGAPATQMLTDLQNLVAKADRAGVPFVMFNAAWSWAFFQAAADRAGIELTAPAAGVIDIQVLDKALVGSRSRRALPSVLSEAGFTGQVPTDPVGISKVLVGLAQRVAGAPALHGKDVVAESARLYYEQEEETVAYRASQSLAYRPTLPYPGVVAPATVR